MLVVISFVVIDDCRGRDRACGLASGLAEDAVAGFVDRPDAIVAWAAVRTVAALAGVKLVRSRAAA